jgi:mannose-6-phosphate isomerase-like protein (cupin superfamily)
MPGFHTNIEQDSLKNNFFRKVLFTAKHSQLVLMSLNAGEDIGEETHDHVDQFIRVESGQGTAILNGKSFALGDGAAVVIPAGVRHNIVNASKSEALKLYTLYSPPNHPDGTIHKTRAEAMEAEKHEH